MRRARRSSGYSAAKAMGTRSAGRWPRGLPPPARRRTIPGMKTRSRKRPAPPKTLRDELLVKQNRAAAAQTRKVLGRHYAAKYRVHKGR